MAPLTCKQLTTGGRHWSWGGGILLLALLIYLPNWLLDTKWLLGYPSRAQKVTAEAYALLGLGHPLRPTVTVKEV